LSKRKAWEPCGYVSRSKTGASMVVAVFTGEDEKIYMIADLNETLEVLKGKRAYTKLYRRRI